MKPTTLLNDDGTASMATMLMTSHQALRRDLARFKRALTSFDAKRIDALRNEWKDFCQNLRVHHKAEDEGIFPSTRIEHPELAPAVVQLSDQHRRINPLLKRGDQAFTSLPATANALAVLADLTTLLDAHLDMEEATVMPTLRRFKQFPAPPDAAAVEVFADGFAWSLQGVAPDVVAKICEMLPEALLARLPAAREKFAARCERAWGTAAAGTTMTSIPA